MQPRSWALALSLLALACAPARPPNDHGALTGDDRVAGDLPPPADALQASGDPESSGDETRGIADDPPIGDPLLGGDVAGSGDLGSDGDTAAPGDSASGDPGPPHLICDLGTTTTVQSTTVDLLHAYLAYGDSLAVVDVREPTETASGIIAGALLYPWSSGVLSAQHASLPNDRPLFVICAGGSRSSLATTFLVNNGHTCVHNVSGGMNAWKSAHYPTVLP